MSLFLAIKINRNSKGMLKIFTAKKYPHFWLSFMKFSFLIFLSTKVAHFCYALLLDKSLLQSA